MLQKSDAGERKKNTPLSFHVTAIPYINEENGNIQLSVCFEGSTPDNKDAIKALGGYHWSSREAAADMFSLKKPPMCWNKVIELPDLAEETKKAVSIGAENLVSEKGLFATLNYEIALEYQEAWKKKKDAIAKLEKPEKPEILSNKRWNQKVYGKSGNYSIYLDGEKVSITDEQNRLITEYLDKKEEYQKKVEDIERSKDK